MKKKLAIVGLLGFTFLFGCNVDNGGVEANQEDGVTVHKLADNLNWGIHEITHKESGCKFIVHVGAENSTMEKLSCEEVGE